MILRNIIIVTKMLLFSETPVEINILKCVEYKQGKINLAC